MKRKMTSLLLVLALVLAMSAAVQPALAAAGPMEEILGVYEGYYYATQGQTGVTLSVYQEGSEVKAIFDFYNLPNRTNAEEGKFCMDVRYEGGQYYFDATDWIDQPSGYLTVDLELNLNSYVLSGNVTYSGGTYQFYAEKPNDAYAQIQESVYNGHRYERIDTPMSWSQARDYAQERGGYLATITSAGEQSFLEGFLSNGTKDRYWLGASASNSTLQWLTGETSPYTHWANNPGSNSCLQIVCRGNQAMRWSTAADTSSSDTGFVVEYGVWSSSSAWAETELQGAYENDLIPDVLIGRDMKGQITRGEFAAVAVKLYEAMSGNRTIIAMDAPFQDIDCAERLYILKAYNYSIVAGTGPTTYAPKDLITREQMATMLTRVVKKVTYPNYTIETDAEYPLAFNVTKKFADDEDISDFAYSSVYFMAENNIIAGLGNNLFAPKNTTSAQAAAYYANATREQALLLSVRCLSNLSKD